MQCKNSGCQEVLVDRGSKLVCPKCGFSIEKSTVRVLYGPGPGSDNPAGQSEDKFLDWTKPRFEPGF
jgi:hypothetical protein